MSVTIRLDTTKLNQLIAQVPGNVDKIVQESAHAIEAEAKKNIRAWPLIDTGALLNSIMAERVKSGLWEIGDFGEYHGSRESRYSKRKVSSSMEYAVYWELGHHNLFTRHYMRMPFLGPAVAKEASLLAGKIARGLFK